MIEIFIFSLNLFIIGFFIHNPIFIFLNKSKNNAKNYQLANYSKYLIILFAFFLLASHVNFFNSKSELFYYTFLSVTFLIIFVFKKKLILSNYFYDFLIIYFISLILSLNILSDPVLGWDGNFWIEKAKIFSEGKSISDLKNTIFPNYPHLGSYLWGFFWKNNIPFNEINGRLVFIFIYVFSIYNLCNYFFSNNLDKIACTLLSVFLTYRFEFFTGYQDNLIFSLILISLILMINYSKNRNIYNLLYFNFSIFLILWVKNEGLIAYVLLSLMLLFFFKKKIPNQHKSIFLIISISLFLIKMFYFIYFNNELVFQKGINLENFFSNVLEPLIFIKKIFLIIKHLFIKSFYIPIFIFFIIVSIIFTKISYKERVFLIIVIICYSSPYLFSSNSEDIDRLIWHLKTSYDRLLFQASAFFLFFVVKNLSKYNKYI